MAVKSFGKVTVAAGGTPSRATANLTLATGQSIPLQSILIQALPGNTGLVYIMVGLNAAVDDRTNLAYCVGILPAPASATQGPFPSISFGLPATPAGLILNAFWIDVSVNGNGVIISGTTG